MEKIATSSEVSTTYYECVRTSSTYLCSELTLTLALFLSRFLCQGLVVSLLLQLLLLLFCDTFLCFLNRRGDAEKTGKCESKYFLLYVIGWLGYAQAVG